MYPQLLLHAILPNLLPSQIDSMSFCNPHLKDYIARNRLDLPRTLVDRMHIRFDPLSTAVFIESTKKIRSFECSEKLRESLNRMKPQTVYFYFNCAEDTSSIVGQRWIKDIESLIIFCNKHSDGEIGRLVPHLKCSSFTCNYKLATVEVEELLEGMPHVQRLYIKCVSFPSNCMDKVIEKSKLGPGIHRFEIGTNPENAMNSYDLIQFLENASLTTHEDYPRVLVRIEYLTGAPCEFDFLIRRLERNVSVEKVNEMYRITINDSPKPFEVDVHVIKFSQIIEDEI